MTVESRLGDNIRRLREARGWSQEHLSHRAGVVVRHIGRVERGGGNPSLAILIKIADALEVDILDLFARSPTGGDPPPAGRPG